MDLKELRLHGEKRMHLCVISGFRRGVNEIRALLGFYAAQKVSFFTDVSGQHIGPLEDGTDRLSRNVGKKLPFYAAYNRKRARIWMHLAQNTDKWRALVSTVINLQVP
jgi:hypothetical protein